MNYYLLAIIVYSVVLIATGLIVSKYVKVAADFFVAGRQLGPGLLFTTLIAPNIGAGSTVGVAGLAYKAGLSAWWWIGASAVGSFILAFAIGPVIWRLAKRHNLLTLGDYLEHRYNRRFRGVISLLLAVGSLAIFAGQLMGVAWILNVVAGTEKTTGVIIGAVVVMAYFGAGGLWGAAVVNLIQIAVKFLGFGLAVPFAISYVGGFDGLQAMIASNSVSASQAEAYVSMDGLGITTIVGYFLMLMPSFFISPGLIGKIYGAKDEKTVLIGGAANALVQLFFAIVPVILGMCAFAVYPELSDRELALPTVMKEFMPFWASTLALAAIFSAEISAADAVLYMVTSAFTNDLYKTFYKPEMSDQSFLQASRVVSFVAGVLGVSLALLLPNIITALTIFYALMSVSLTAPLLFGLFSQRPTVCAAFASAAAGIVMTVGLQFFNQGKGLWILNAQSTGILLAIAVMMAFMYLAPAVKTVKTN